MYVQYNMWFVIILLIVGFRTLLGKHIRYMCAYDRIRYHRIDIHRELGIFVGTQCQYGILCVLWPIIWFNHSLLCLN